METNKKFKEMSLLCSYVYKDSIQRVWDCFRLPEIFNQTLKDNAENITMLKGQNYGEVGTVVEFEWKNSFVITFEVKEVVNTECYKKIRFYTTKVYPMDLKYTCTFHFYWNTIGKTTLFQHELTFDDSSALKVIDQKHNKQEKLEICKKIEKFLSKRVQDLSEFESVIINRNITIVWEVISNWKNFQNYVPIIAERVEFEDGAPKVVGSRINIENPSKKSKYSLKVLKCESSNDKREYVVECLEAEPVSPRQELHFCLVLVNENITYLSFKHEFKEPIKYELINSITRDKKHILKELKKRLEQEDAKVGNSKNKSR
jgi:hypothetical protein